MNQTQKIKLLYKIAHEINGTVPESYSGRGVSGKSCCGISTAKPIECIETAASHGIRGARTNNMGLDTVVYWPSISNQRTMNKQLEKQLQILADAAEKQLGPITQKIITETIESYEKMMDWITIAEQTLKVGIDLMPIKQLTKWEGVRTIIETTPDFK